MAVPKKPTQKKKQEDSLLDLIQPTDALSPADGEPAASTDLEEEFGANLGGPTPPRLRPPISEISTTFRASADR